MNSPKLLSQSTATDSVKISAKAARNLLVAAQQKQILQDEVANLNDRIAEKDKQLSILLAKDSATINSLQKEIALTKEQIAVMQDQRGIYDAELKAIRKQLKREKRKRTLTGVAGMITTAAAFYIGTR